MGAAKFLKAALSRALGFVAGERGDAQDRSVAVDHVEAPALAEAEDMLRTMLLELEELSPFLPSDAKPMAIAAREIIEVSLAECRKPVANAARIKQDMGQLNALALAMRERLLLSPQERRKVFAN